jgi:hypothetical protein
MNDFNNRREHEEYILLMSRLDSIFNKNISNDPRVSIEMSICYWLINFLII